MGEIQIDIKPTGIVSAIVYAPFDVGKQELESRGYPIISLEENAGLRIQEGKGHNVSRNGNWVKEDVLYVPNKGKFLTKNSPIMQNPKEATQAHRGGEEYYLNDEQTEQSLQDSVELNRDSIPFRRFNDEAITVYAFGNTAENYGLFLKETLKEKGIEEMPICLANIEKKPFARKLWFRNLGGDSELGGYLRDLDGGDRLRGIVYVSGLILIWKLIIFILKFIQ